MWVLRYLFFYVVLSVFGLTLFLFLGQNVHTERLVFFGLEYTTNMVWVLLGAVAFGVLIVLALLLPGRFASMLHAWGLQREVQHMEQDLEKLQELREHLLNRHEHLLEAHERLLQGYHRLVARHSQTVAERDWARSQLAARDGASAAQARVASGAAPARLTLLAPEATRAPTKVPDLAIVSPVAAAVGAQPNGAHAGRAPSGQGVAPASGAGPAAGRGRDLPAEAVREVTRPARVELAEPDSAERRPAIGEQVALSRTAGRADAALASERSPAPAAPPLALAVEPEAPTEQVPPTPTLPTPTTSSSPVPAAPAAAAQTAPLPRPAISISISIGAPSGRMLVMLRDRLRDDIARSAVLLAVLRAALQGTFTAKLAQLKRLRLPVSLLSGPANDTSGDPPDSTDPDHVR